MNYWIVITILEEFLEDCRKFTVYGTNKSYLEKFSQMQTGDSLLIQLRAKSRNRNFAYLGPYTIIDNPHSWASVEEKRIPWFKIRSNNGPRWLQKFQWCVFLTPSVEYIDSLRVLKEVKDPSDGILRNEEGLKILNDLIQDEYLPHNSRQAYRTNRGVWVRSRAEYMIDNWFSARGIVTYYEIPIFLSRQRFLPDWYIPRLKLYIEYLGLQGDREYDLKWENKKSIYDKNNLRYISLEDSDLENLNISIPQKIPQIKQIMDN